MVDRKVKGKSVIYVPAGETFIAENGLRYKAVPDSPVGYPCAVCDFFPSKMGMCGRYRCIGDDREDGKGVHFEECKGEEQSKTN